MCSGAAIAYTRLGRPDIGLVAMSEVVDTTAMIRDRVGAHLVVDADTGYGNALNVSRTVRLFERAGRTRFSSKIRHFPSDAGISTTRRWSRRRKWLARSRPLSTRGTRAKLW